MRTATGSLKIVPASLIFGILAILLAFSPRAMAEPQPAPVPVSPSALTFEAMRGGNIFSGKFWFATTPELAGTAESMNMNFARLNINMGIAVQNHQEDLLLTDLQETMAALNQHHIKAIVTLGGYAMYDQPCATNRSFVEVEDLAKHIVAMLKGNPSLYAFELMNEAYSTMGDGHKCDKKSINQAVHSMYALVRSIDRNVPTTVSEAWYYWYLPTWQDVSSFASFHIYPQVKSPLTPDQLAKAQKGLADYIDKARAKASPLPLMIGEIGVQKLTEPEAAQFYQAMYAVLRQKNIGSFFWNLSTDDPSFATLHRDGTPTLQAGVIQQELAPRPAQ